MNKKLIALLKEKFKARLQAKTGWGRNDVMIEFEAALNEAMLEIIDAD